MVKNNVVSLTSVSSKASTISSLDGDALVIGVAKGAEGAVLLDHPLTEQEAAALSDSLPLLGISGAADEVRRLPSLSSIKASVLVLIGLGPVEGGAPQR